MEALLSSDFLNLATNDQHKVLMIVLLTIGWFWLYSLVHFTYQSKQLKYNTLLDTRNRIVSMVHGVISFLLACIAFPNNHFKYLCIDSVNPTVSY